ncbi:MAG: WhiB family transcriptional regulator [Actinobacteria bacterium]|nr:MAG: WhiB family transcriptional regulator [Actinomycetota bacterium]
MQWVNDWITQSACRDQDPDALFVQGAAQNRAKQVCGGCVVRVECLADALDNRIEFGVWGGMTERERRALLRRRPEVLSWTNLLMSARERCDNSGDDSIGGARRGRATA